MKIDGLLPIGSVVRLASGTHRLMITGYAQRLQDSNEACDYVACLWPEGHQGPDKSIVFNGVAIEDVYFLGYQTDGQKVYASRIETALAAYREKAAN